MVNWEGGNNWKGGGGGGEEDIHWYSSLAQMINTISRHRDVPCR